MIKGTCPAIEAANYYNLSQLKQFINKFSCFFCQLKTASTENIEAFFYLLYPSFLYSFKINSLQSTDNNVRFYFTILVKGMLFVFDAQVVYKSQCQRHITILIKYTNIKLFDILQRVLQKFEDPFCYNQSILNPCIHSYVTYENRLLFNIFGQLFFF